MLKRPLITKNKIVQWIKDYFEREGKGCAAVVGISGGKDSSVVAALCAEALGKDNVYGVIMPNHEQADVNDAFELCRHLGIKYTSLNIGTTFDALGEKIENAIFLQGNSNEHIGFADAAKINLAPRLRMAALYAIAQSLPNGGRVANTGNLSERFVGYTTKYGDSVGDFAPIGSLCVSEVIQIGESLRLPDKLIHKVPSDGLCGMSDEEKLGFTYDKLEEYLKTGTTNDELLDEKIAMMNENSMHKYDAIPMYYMALAEELR